MSSCKRCKELEQTLDRGLVLLDEARAALLQGAAELRKASARELARGAEPHWLAKDFNVLYRAALAYFDASDDGSAGWPGESKARRALGAQLERLKPAFQDTEVARRIAREEG